MISNTQKVKSRFEFKDALGVIIGQLPYAVILYDPQAGFLVVNTEAGRLIGLEDIPPGRNFAVLSISALNDNEAEKYLNLLLRQPEPSGSRRENLREKVLDVKWAPFSFNGHAGRIIFFTDVTETAKLQKEVQRLKDLKNGIEIIFDLSYDELYLVDASGKTLWVNNAACQRLYNLRAEDLIGRNVKDLEKEGIFYPSIATEVMAKKSRMTTVQWTKTGKKIIVTANPILDENGNVSMIISNSREVSEISALPAGGEAPGKPGRYYQYIPPEPDERSKLYEGIIAYSPEMKRVLALAEKVARVDSNVLLLGESGVGKDVVARLIHRLSSRRKGPFVKINCGAIPDSLLESELFGYEAGAFTGARREGKSGLVELAGKGTLFLDEIGELSLPLQVKLLNVLQDRQLFRIGGTRPVQVDARFMAATNRNLEEMVREGRFREDLYYRLNVVPVEIPPLRTRHADIPPLIAHFLDFYCRKYNVQKRINAAALNRLLNYSWPGNVRELENVIERLVVTTDAPEIETGDLPGHLQQTEGSGEARVLVTGLMPLKDAVNAVEQQLLKMALAEYHTFEAAAAALGVHPTTIGRKMKASG